MNRKVIICLAGCILLTTGLLLAHDIVRQTGNTALYSQREAALPPRVDTVQSPARDTAQSPARDTAVQVRDSARQSHDSSIQVKDSARPATDNAAKAKDTTKPAQDANSGPAAIVSKPRDIMSMMDSTAPKPADKPEDKSGDKSTDDRSSANSTQTTSPAQSTDAAKSQDGANGQNANGQNANGQQTAGIQQNNGMQQTPEAQQNATAIQTANKQQNADGQQSAVDTIHREPAQEAKRELDPRWFISPLLKFQFQDFGMLEKNRKGYLSDANTLPIQKRGNISFAASAYKNLTSRISFSADLGLSFGHVTSDTQLISHTNSKTFNLLNATVYYHLLNASYRLQPYVSVGINDIINEASYASIPFGIGAKFNAKKIMVTGQVMYGYSISKNLSNTTMYSVGVYIPIKNKKWKKSQEEDQTPYNRTAKKDTTNGAKVVNNFYFNIASDSSQDKTAKEDGVGGGRRRGENGDGGDGDDDGVTSRHSSSGRHKKGGGIKSFNLQDFNMKDLRVDTVNGRPVIKFIIYFEFNQYALTSRAFGSVDKVITQLKDDRGNLQIDIKGYTDDVGTDEYNNFLSRRRAKTVFDYMNSRGVPGELMKAKAYGKDNPVADNKDPNQAWLNRRAEIIVREK